MGFIDAGQVMWICHEESRTDRHFDWAAAARARPSVRDVIYRRQLTRRHLPRSNGGSVSSIVPAFVTWKSRPAEWALQLAPTWSGRDEKKVMPRHRPSNAWRQAGS